MSYFYNMNAATEIISMDDEQQQQQQASETPVAALAPPPPPESASSAGQERPPEPSAKRLACNPCRDRKVRCDRQHPTCGRCAKLGNNCVYSSPSKQTVSKLDLSRLLLTLHSRLEQAEAQLAFNTPPIPNVQQFAYPWPDMVPTGQGPSDVIPIPEPAPLIRPASRTTAPDPQDPHSRGSISSVAMPDVTTEWYGSLEPSISTDFSSGSQSVNDTFDVDPVFQEFSPSPYSDAGSQCSSSVPAALFPRLHASFFDVFHPVMPFINRMRLQSELAQSPDSIQLQALSHAVGALGALANVELTCALEACYNQARTLLEMCERQENGANLLDINTLQAYVLLSVYEFSQPNFARAWMTLGRAIQLAKIMCLDRNLPIVSSDAELFFQLPQILDPALIEERRRTFWQLYILDSFAAMRTKSTPVFDGRQISTPLPCAAELSNVTELSGMPTLSQICEAKNVQLSSFAGVVIMIFVYRRIFDHIQAWIEQPSYPFWDTHYATDKIITHCRSHLIGPHIIVPTQGHSDVLAILLRMNLGGLEIKLHEIAITKIDKEKLPTALTTEAIVRCQSAAMDIVDAVRSGQRLKGRDMEIFRHSNLFYAKTMTKAIQAYMWMLNHLKNNAPAHINALRMLSNSMRELIDPKHLRPGLLEQVDAKVAEAERPKKRPYVPSTNNF
ncbi:fungal-specific transcription factor domain-containing protein [Hypoxylon crocopeplum]|nr:fungal-specific transcription factor domain-containing protein [Hypoxylon crocopeplum]